MDGVVKMLLFEQQFVWLTGNVNSCDVSVFASPVVDTPESCPGNVCGHLVQNGMTSRMWSENLKFKFFFKKVWLYFWHFEARVWYLVPHSKGRMHFAEVWEEGAEKKNYEFRRMFIGPCIIVIVEELETNLMSLVIFITLNICSTCFEH